MGERYMTAMYFAVTATALALVALVAPVGLVALLALLALCALKPEVQSDKVMSTVGLGDISMNLSNERALLCVIMPGPQLSHQNVDGPFKSRRESDSV